MKNVFLLAGKEIAFFLFSPIGYIISGLFVAFVHFFFFSDFFVVGVLTQRGFFELVPWFSLFLIAGISMRSFAEEQRANTLEILLTLPFSEEDIVLGKFCGALAHYAITLLLTVSIPLSFFFLGKPFIPEIVVSYVGLLFFGAALIALGNLISLQTKNQIAAMLGTLLVYALLLTLGTDAFTRYVPSGIGEVLVYLSPLYHLESFFRGVITLRSVVYFISTTCVWLLLSVIFLRRRSK